MWQKILAIIFLFYLFTLLQVSFFVHFAFLGIVPNLIFILFSLFLFFSEDGMYQILFLSIIAGLCLDVFSYSYMGQSVVILAVVGILFKKMQTSLNSKRDKQPFAYFWPLFLIWFFVYTVLHMVYFRFIDLTHVPIKIDLLFFAQMIYNLFFASIFFLIFKKIVIYAKKLQN